MNKNQTLGIVRHLLTFAGGYFVAKGVIDEGAVTELSAALLTIIGDAWSFIAPEKK